MIVGENINLSTQYLKSFLALGMELPSKAHVTGPTGAGEFIQESGQHGAGHQLLKSHRLVDVQLCIYHRFNSPICRECHAYKYYFYITLRSNYN